MALNMLSQPLQQDLVHSTREQLQQTQSKLLREKELEKQSSMIIEDHIKRPYSLQDIANQEPWQLLSEIPSGPEILDNTSGSELPENPMPNSDDPSPKPWKDKASYLEAQYKLLRQDALLPLKLAVQEFTAEPALGDSHQTSIYTHVYIVGYTFSQTGAAAKLQFSAERAGKRIHWSQTKRLQQGTLVALSPYKDNFRTTCKVAVIAARSLGDVEMDPPQVDIFWSSPEEAEFDPTERWVMVEAKSGYFEASRHMLVAFQKAMFETCLLSEHLVGVESEVGAPDFLEAQPFMNLESLARFPAANAHGLKSYDLTNVNVLEQFPSVGDGKLDMSQMEALKRILTKKVAIIQGPPGTGKTFVSVEAILVMLRNWVVGDPPIIVAAQTNHALDQLLNKIATYESHILRLGGRAKEDDEVIQSVTLHSRRQEARRYLSGIDGRRNAASKWQNQLANVMIADINKMNLQDANEAALFFELGLLTKAQYDSISDDGWTRAEEDVSPFKAWLKSHQGPSGSTPPLGDCFEEDEDTEYEALDEQEMEARKAKDDDDLEILRGPYHQYRRNFIGLYTTERALAEQVPRLLKTFSNLDKVPENWRGAVYQYLKDEASKCVRSSFRDHMKQYCSLADDIKVAKWEQNVQLVRKLGIKLIGCTTTGLSKYRGMIAALQPRTLLIEEAAETLEGTVLGGIFESLEQLILVGDHEQLQAHCNVSSLAEAPYNLSVSLFQRLVKNGMEYTMLNTQRRMTPQLSALLESVYDGLEDHASVHGRADVPGMGGRNSYFFTHNWEESRDEALSRYNVEEAEMLVNFFMYLVLNGVNPSQITVLTFYNGQRRKLVKLLKEKPSLKNGAPLNVNTVDSYQGEENDIILLSLVRSNDDCNIGFLENKNRAVVALSRARRGLYIFGNLFSLLANNKTESYELWRSVFVILQQRSEAQLGDRNGPNADGGVLPLVCQKHGRTTLITRAWELADRGGCNERCRNMMRCGHTCQSTCHWLDHDDMVCKQPCMRAIACCSKGHICVMMCFQRCQCQCPDSELLRPAVSTAKPNTSASRRMIQHSLGGQQQNPPVYPAPSLQHQLQGSALAHRPHPSAAPGNGQMMNQFSRGLPMAPGPPLVRDVFRPVLLNGNGRQVGPASITHYQAQSSLPLTPNAAAALSASSTAPLRTVLEPSRPQQIVAVVTRNEVNGQLSRHPVVGMWPPLHHPMIAAGPVDSRFMEASHALPANAPHTTSAHPQQFASQTASLSSGYAAPIGRLANGSLTESRRVEMAPPSTSSKPGVSQSGQAGTAILKPASGATMRVFIAGLPFQEFVESDLRELFLPYGEVLNPVLWVTHRGAPIGSGTVIMMRADALKAIKALDGKTLGTRYLKVREFLEDRQARRRPSPNRRPTLPPGRLRRARSLGAIKAGDQRPDRTAESPERRGQSEGPNSWPMNAVVAEAGAVPFIPEIPSALEPPPGEPRKPNLAMELLANRARPVADGMETVLESTVLGPFIDNDEKRAQLTPGGVVREVPEMEYSSAKGEDLIDFEDGERAHDDNKNDNDDVMSFTTRATVGVRPRAQASATLVSLLDFDEY